jgi:GH25 family lysozyme M1 (1,4-beta-N-acetylmuramidase)
MTHGIDISTFQSVIDFDKLLGKVDFVMIRAGYGQNNIDKYFKRNIEECNKRGIPCGVYWFSYALNEEMARREARFCLEAVKPYRLEYPIAFDFEYDSVSYAARQGVTMTKELASAICKAFCGEIEANKYYCLNYTNSDFLNRYFDADCNRRFAVWLAAWNNGSQPPRTCQIWQYTNNFAVEGISGRVDANRCYIDFPTVIKNAHLNHLDDPMYSEPIAWAINNGIITPDEIKEKGAFAEMLYKYDKAVKA